MNTVISPVISLCLRVARGRSALSPEELATRLGLSVEELVANEAGEGPLGDLQIEEWARALKSTPWAILSLALLDADQITSTVNDAPTDRDVRILPFVVRKTIERLGLSQVTLAARIGIQQSTVNRWASGAVPLTEETITRIAEALETTTEKLIVEALTYEDPALEQAKGALLDAFTTWLRARYLAAVETKRAVPSALAEQIGVNRSALSRFGQGKTLIPSVAYALHLELDRLLPVAHLLGIPVGAETGQG